MLLNRGKILLKNFKGSRNLGMSNMLLNKMMMNKNFSSKAHDSHGDSHGHDNHGHDDHGHDDHGHHEITGEVDMNKVYVPIDSNFSRFIALTGVAHSSLQINQHIEGQCKAKAEITPITIPLITRNRVYFNDLAGVKYEDNPYFHSEPYGYLITDDPWDPNPQTWQPYMVLAAGFFGVLIFYKLLRLFNLHDKRILSEEIYHAHYTANLIEDEIRRIRKEDYPFRKRYEELKNPNQ